MAQRFTCECEFRKWQVFSFRVNAPSAGITSNFDLNRSFRRREENHPDVHFLGIGPKISVLIARYAFTHVHLYWRVRVPQMAGVQIPCKCPISGHHIKFRPQPRVPKARREPSRCEFLRNWPENICADRMLRIYSRASLLVSASFANGRCSDSV